MLQIVRRALAGRPHVIVINKVLPRDLTGLGFRLRDPHAPHGQTYMHPKGHELWLLSYGGTSPAQAVDEDSGEDIDPQEDAALTELRDKVTWIEQMKNRLMSKLIELERSVGKPGYADRYKALFDDWNFFDKQMRLVQGEISAYQADADDQDLARGIPVFDRMERLRSWADSGAFMRRAGVVPSP
jgi:hypothetical protein